jgi:penicillin-binding protein 1A
MWLNGQGVTGGSLPTQAWHAFMSVAHTSKNIPTIPGLQPHPVQVAEQQRLAELKRTDPGLAQAQIVQAQKKSSIMPDQTREALKRLADSMLRASGQQAVPVSAPPASLDAAPPPDKARDPKQPPRRTEAPTSGMRAARP